MVQQTSTSPSCATCAELEQRQEPEEYHCRHGRFDRKKPRWFAAAGIARPNKTVAQTQQGCPFISALGIFTLMSGLLFMNLSFDSQLQKALMLRR